MSKTPRFDAADYLDSEKRQVAYITAALESGDADFVRDALGVVAKARGMGEIAKSAGLNRESLYKALGGGWDSSQLPQPKDLGAKTEASNSKPR